jgi:hypothetical protein
VPDIHYAVEAEGPQVWEMEWNACGDVAERVAALVAVP